MAAADKNIFIRYPLLTLCAAVFLGGIFYVWGKSIEAREFQPAVISVSGEGRVFAAPDIADLSFGVQTGRQPTAKQAMDMLRERITASIGAVKAAGIADKDIRTENFWISPAYDWTERGQIFRGFEANQSIRVKVRDLDKVSTVLEAATAAGANQAGGVNFTIDVPEEKRAEAREKAIEQAEEKARAIAADLGMRLGEVKGFAENGGGYAPMVARAEMGMGGAMAVDKDEAMNQAVPLPAGEQEITVMVSISYELE